ncbi:MAG: hypothetical protein JNK58_00605 [Phycisphaerae bacterium]|nr:hypothetical protein [Phycisphaerae bacterium]
MTIRIIPSQRRGSAVVAMLVALAMLQVLVAAIVLAGARADELTSLRLDTARAFYAAEAGANMATREVMIDSDVDSDGVIGSVSGDGIDSNDPALGVARMSATASTAVGVTTITVTGRAGHAARRITLSVQSN